MIWTAYLDESGTHDSPIMLMGGYLANDHQWDAFNDDWLRLLNSFGVKFCHGKDLEKGKKQFKNWPRKKRNALILEADRIVATHLELGVTAIIRANDYDAIYKSAPNPSRLLASEPHFVYSPFLKGV
jgi:hypothetical protein